MKTKLLLINAVLVICDIDECIIANSLIHKFENEPYGRKVGYASSCHWMVHPGAMPNLSFTAILKRERLGTCLAIMYP